MRNGIERYQVTITYAEPTYASARGIAELAYKGVFHVSACDPDEAIELATKLFHDAQWSSGVGWAREIRAVECSIPSIC